MNNSALICLIVFIGIIILIPTGLAIYRSVDYKRQITGKREIRSSKNIDIRYEDETKTSEEAELLKDEARMKSAQNIFGPPL